MRTCKRKMDFSKYALSILWSVCKLAPNECFSIAVDVGLAAKLLLVIQSGCNPTLKQQSAELLKLWSLNFSVTIFISMCKLTRTIQWAWNSFNLLMSTICKFEGERSKRSATYEKYPKFGVWGGISPVYILVFWFQQFILMKEES